MTNKKITFAVQDIHIIDNEIDKSQFSKLLVDCFSTAKSAHNTIVSEETLRKTAKTILLKPFVFIVDSRFDDVGSHDKKEMPGGFVPHDSAINFKTMPSGEIMFSVEVLIWKRYSGKLLEYFKRDGNRKSVSVELEILDAVEDEKTGLVELKDYVFNAITCLGNIFQPAIPNAQAVLQFAEEFEKVKEEYEFSSRYKDIDFKIPEHMKKNAEKALNQYKDGAGKANSVALAVGRYIIKNDIIAPERVRQIHKALHREGMLDEMSKNLYGGNEARQWSSEIVEKMNEIDSKGMLYLGAEDPVIPMEQETDIKEMSANENIEGMEENKDMAKTKEEMAAEEEMKEHKEMMPAEEGENKEHEEMAAEEKEEPKKEEKADSEVSMSSDANLDVSALLEFLKNETKVYRDMTDKQSEGINYAINLCMGEIAKGKDFSAKIVTDGMISYMVQASAKVADLSEKAKTYSEENKVLREFKQDIENKQKQYEVDTVLKEAFDAGMPEDELEICKSEAVNFSLAEIDSYKNMVKAKAFKHFGKRRDNKNSVTRIGLPFTEQKHKEPVLWK